MTNRFKVERDKNGMSQCYNCGAVSWHSFMYRDTKYNEMVCDRCRDLIVQGKPQEAKMWKFPNFEPKHRQENSEVETINYYDLRPMLGKEIDELREKVLEDDRVTNPKFYEYLDLFPDKYYMASIVYEDITELTSIYIEEIIYEKED